MFLVDLVGVGGRLQHVQLNTRCGELAAHGSVLITSIDVPAGRAIEAELGLAQADIGGFVAGVGGQHERGDQWIALLQQVPAGGRESALQIRDGAIKRAEIEHVANEYWATEQLVREYFVSCVLARLLTKPRALPSGNGQPALSAVALKAIVGGLALSKLAQLLCIELTNYPVEAALAAFPLGCGLPGQEHDCRADVVADILNGWLELKGRPWVLD